jgi:hypothetical protein
LNWGRILKFKALYIERKIRISASEFFNEFAKFRLSEWGYVVSSECAHAFSLAHIPLYILPTKSGDGGLTRPVEKMGSVKLGISPQSISPTAKDWCADGSLEGATPCNVGLTVPLIEGGWCVVIHACNGWW